MEQGKKEGKQQQNERGRKINTFQMIHQAVHLTSRITQQNQSNL